MAAADPPGTAGLSGPDARTPPPIGDRPADPTEFLSPPRAAGELGWLAHYRVRRQLGAGGMGVVFLAEDTLLQRPVALKVMQPSLAADAANRDRFLREARAAARLTHDHVVTIHQVGEANGAPYLAMQLLHGESLEDYLDEGKRLSHVQVCRIGREAAVGLAAAHARGLIHRDVKPANLWLEAPKGRVKILDFGLARPAGDAKLTTSGMVLGTPAYMAPEQARGQHLDGRCDLWSLGVVLYRLCTGRLPFKGADVIAVATALALDEPPPVRDLAPDAPPELANLVMQLLAKDRDRRPASAAEVAERLQRIERGLVKTARPAAAPVPRPADPTAAIDQPAPPTLPQPAARRPRAGPFVVALLAGACGAVLAGVIVIKIRHPDGTVTEVRVPDGAGVAVEKDGKEVARIEPAAAPADADDDAPAAAADEAVPAGPRVKSRATLGGHEQVVVFLGFSADGRVLASGDMRQHAIVRDGTFGTPTARTPDLVGFRDTKPGATKQYALSPDGKLLAVRVNSGSGGVLALFDADTGREAAALVPRSDVGFAQLAFAPDGRTLAAGRLDGSVQLWDVPARALRTTLVGPKGREVAKPGWLQAVAFSPAGDRIAIGDIAGGVVVRDAATGEPKLAIDAGSYVHSVTFTPDGRELVTVAPKVGRVQRWDARTGKAIGDPLPVGTDEAAALSPDGRFLAVGYYANKAGGARVVELATGRTVFTTRAEHAGGLKTVAWAPDGKTLATANWGLRDRVVKLWPTAELTSSPPPPAAAGAAPAAAPPTPAEQMKAVIEDLKRRNPGFAGAHTFAVRGGAVAKLTFSTDRVVDLTPLQALTGLEDLECTGNPNGATGRLADLTPLRDLKKLQVLHLQFNGKLADLRPLAGLKLRKLNVGGTAVRDLAPLAGMPLGTLWMGWTPAADLSPLRGLPLTYLDCQGQDRDLTPLRDLPRLEGLKCVYRPERDAAALRAIKTLKTVNDKPAAEVLGPGDGAK